MCIRDSHRKTSAWDTCAPSAAVLAAGGRVTDYFGAPLSYTGAVGNTLGVIASSKRASKAHDATCATLRRDARALAVLERYGVRVASHAADIARDLSGAPLAVATVADAAPRGRRRPAAARSTSRGTPGPIGNTSTCCSAGSAITCKSRSSSSRSKNTRRIRVVTVGPNASTKRVIPDSSPEQPQFSDNQISSFTQLSNVHSG